MRSRLILSAAPCGAPARNGRQPQIRPGLPPLQRILRRHGSLRPRDKVREKEAVKMIVKESDARTNTLIVKWPLNKYT